jgi:hypothetical protein
MAEEEEETAVAVQDSLAMVEEDQEVLRKETEVSVAEIEISGKEDLLRCMKLHVINVNSNAKFHSDQLETNQYIALLASSKQAIQDQEETPNKQCLQCQKSNLQK